MEEFVTVDDVVPDQLHTDISETKETSEKPTSLDLLKEKVDKLNYQLDASDWKCLSVRKQEDPETIFAQVVSYNQPDMANTMFIEDLWVDPSIQGQGIGSLLMKAYEQCASENDIRRIRLFASGTGDLVKFYEALGYTRESPNRTIMIKDLSSSSV